MEGQGRECRRPWLALLGVTVSTFACHGAPEAAGAAEPSAFDSSAGSNESANAGAPNATSTSATGGDPSGGALGVAGFGSEDASDTITLLTNTCLAYAETVCVKTRYECAMATPPEDPCPEYTDWCPDLLFAEGSHVTVADALACRELWAATSCDDINRYAHPRCALPGGDLPFGAPCAFSTQCESGSCGAVGQDEEHPDCGICTEPIPYAGEPCESTCTGEAECVEGVCQETFVFNLGAGESCTRAGQCISGYYCYPTEDRSERRCQPVPGLGEPCDRVNVCTRGHHCADGTCTESPGTGSPCALVPPIADSGITWDRYFCSNDAYCEEAETPSPSCNARGRAGEWCQPPPDGVRDAQATCEDGLVCVCDGDDCTTGTCSLRRYPGEGCAGVGEMCAAGSSCQDGVCVAGGLQDWTRRFCGE
jgi:hypothetical protein